MSKREFPGTNLKRGEIAAGTDLAKVLSLVNFHEVLGQPAQLQALWTGSEMYSPRIQTLLKSKQHVVSIAIRETNCRGV